MSKLIIHHMRCKVNGCDGEMIGGKTGFLTNPPRYVHTCDKCGRTRFYAQFFPHQTVEHDTVEEIFH